MSDGMEELTRRLVVGRKNDGRSGYDEAPKAESSPQARGPLSAYDEPGVLT